MHTFQYCLNTSTIRGRDVALERCVDIAAEAGYDGIEPWVRELDDFTARGGKFGDLLSRTNDCGLKIVNLIGFFEWGVDDDARREKGFTEARRCFEIAARLECPFVAAPPMGLIDSNDSSLLCLAQRYAALIDVAGEYGVVPLLEFWGISKTLGSLGEALLVAGECGRGAARVLVDIFHMAKSGGHFEGLGLLGPQAIGLVHLNDYPGSPGIEKLRDSDRVYPGDGNAPLDDIISALAEIGYRGALSLELFNEQYWLMDPLENARLGIRKMKECVTAAG